MLGYVVLSNGILLQVFGGVLKRELLVCGCITGSQDVVRAVKGPQALQTEGAETQRLDLQDLGGGRGAARCSTQAGGG